MKKSIYRHGDMIIFKVDNICGLKSSKNNKKLVIGLGEVTGHSHDILALEDSEIIGLYDGKVEVTENDLAEMDKLFFQVKGNAVIVHEEHKPILLTEGFYLRINQVEYNPFTKELNKVRD